MSELFTNPESKFAPQMPILVNRTTTEGSKANPTFRGVESHILQIGTNKLTAGLIYATYSLYKSSTGINLVEKFSDPVLNLSVPTGLIKELYRLSQEEIDLGIEHMAGLVHGMKVYMKIENGYVLHMNAGGFCAPFLPELKHEIPAPELYLGDPTEIQTYFSNLIDFYNRLLLKLNRMVYKDPDMNLSVNDKIYLTGYIAPYNTGATRDANWGAYVKYNLDVVDTIVTDIVPVSPFGFEDPMYPILDLYALPKGHYMHTIGITHIAPDTQDILTIGKITK